MKYQTKDSHIAQAVQWERDNLSEVQEFLEGFYEACPSKMDKNTLRLHDENAGETLFVFPYQYIVLDRGYASIWKADEFEGLFTLCSSQ